MTNHIKMIECKHYEDEVKTECLMDKNNKNMGEEISRWFVNLRSNL